VSDATSPIDPVIAARLAALEATVAAQQAAIDAERALRTDAEAERDQTAGGVRGAQARGRVRVRRFTPHAIRYVRNRPYVRAHLAAPGRPHSRAPAVREPSHAAPIRESTT